MSSNISSFIGALQGGGARPNRFEVMVAFPSFAAGSDEIRKTAFLVQSTQIPGSTLGTIEQPYRGRFIKLAGDRTFDTWNCTFVNDTDFALHSAFERWHNGINAYNSNIGFLTPAEYMATATVWQLDNQDNRIKEVVLKYVWPESIGPIELGQDSNNVISTFDVTLNFSDIDNQNST